MIMIFLGRLGFPAKATEQKMIESRNNIFFINSLLKKTLPEGRVQEINEKENQP